MIRELRDHLAYYLTRARLGDRITVTQHRRPVAVIGPPDRTTCELMEERRTH